MHKHKNLKSITNFIIMIIFIHIDLVQNTNLFEQLELTTNFTLFDFFSDSLKSDIPQQKNSKSTNSTLTLNNQTQTIPQYGNYSKTYYNTTYKEYIRKNRNRNKSLTYKVLSQNPDVRVYFNFLIEGEAEYLINKIRNRLSRSLTSGGSINPHRTSSSAYFKRSEDGIIFNIEKRICKLVNSTMLKMEPLQIVNYKKNQHYYEHHDWGVDLEQNQRYY